MLSPLFSQVIFESACDHQKAAADWLRPTMLGNDNMRRRAVRQGD
jgi:hypothetical protein